MTKGYTSINESTGDRMVTKPATKAYSENWERIFSKKHLMCAYCDEVVAQGHSSTFDGETYHPECLEEMFQEELVQLRASEEQNNEIIEMSSYAARHRNLSKLFNDLFQDEVHVVLSEKAYQALRAIAPLITLQDGSITWHGRVFECYPQEELGKA